MDKFRCRICKRVFSTSSGLTRHANAMHHGKTSLPQESQSSQSSQSIQSPEHDPILWSTPITMTLEPTSPIFANVSDKNPESEPQDYLQSLAESESEENIEENIEVEEMEMDVQINFEDHDLNSEDL